MSSAPTLRDATPGLFRIARRFGPHLRRQRALIAGGSAGLFAEVVFRLLEPWPLKFVIDAIAVPAGGDTATPVDPDAFRVVVLAALGLVVVVAMRAAAAYASTVCFALAGNRVLTEIRSDLYAHLQRLSIRFHRSSRAGDLVNRVTGDVGRLQEIMVTALLPLTGNLVTFVGMFGVMLWLDWRLALVTLVALPLFLLTNVRLSRRITKVSRAQRAQEGELASVAAESLGAITVVQAYSLEPELQASFGATNRRSLKDGVKAKKLAARLERTTDLFIAVGTGLVLVLGARQVLSGRITPGELVVFLTYLKSGFKPMRDLAKYSGRLAKAAASGERIVAVLDTEPDVVDASWARPAPRLHGDVRFDEVTVEYETGSRALDAVSFHVPAGYRVGVIGTSGSGKSTLGSLLLRLQDPRQGRVLLDGHDARDLTVASLRAQVAIVLQDSVLFAATIRENIAYGAPDPSGATDEQIAAAARLANADEFIRRLPGGYETMIGERGATLSGGERQRIAIARAAMRDAPILVLDEATTGLDERNGAEVLDALRRVSAGRTTFVISHDPAAVADVDLLVRIERGRVVELSRPTQRRSEALERGRRAIGEKEVMPGAASR